MPFYIAVGYQRFQSLSFRFDDFQEMVGKNGFVRKFYEAIKEENGQGFLAENVVFQLYSQLHQINQKEGEIHFLVEIKGQIDFLKNTLSSLKDISFFSFKEDENVQSIVSSLRIDLPLLSHMNSKAYCLVEKRQKCVFTNVDLVFEVKGQGQYCHCHITGIPSLRC